MNKSYKVSTHIPSGIIDISHLEGQIVSLNLGVELDAINLSGDDFSIIFVSALTSLQWDSIESLLSVHAGNPYRVYEQIISRARKYFDDMLEQFGGENIAMGITVLGKTKEVSDYLVDVSRYGATGSLTEVVNTIDSLIADGVPGELAPFVTEDRLNAFRAKILRF